MTWIAALAALALSAGPARAQQPAAAPAPVTQVAPQPGEFLRNVGLKTKARWRQFYREAPPAAPAERLRVAFMLGALFGDSYLAQQAGDVQQFKNTNQDVIHYCKVLGLGEKVTPGFLSVAGTAAREEWPAVRKQVADSQELIEKLLRDQRDEDLATLVDLGMWMRLFEITTAVVMSDAEIKDKTLCIGSVPLLNEIKARYEKLGEETRANEAVGRLGFLLDLLQRHWENAEGHPTADLVNMTAEKIRLLMSRLTLQ